MSSAEFALKASLIEEKGLKVMADCFEMKDFKLNANSIGLFIKTLWQMDLTQCWRITIVAWSKKRTLSANAQQHIWYKQISEFMHCDIREAGNSCKLDFGLPILLADSVHGPKVDFILKRIDFYSMAREQQVNVMDYVPVTSVFSTKQHNQYRDQMQMYYYEQGLNLEYKE